MPLTIHCIVADTSRLTLNALKKYRDPQLHEGVEITHICLI